MPKKKKKTMAVHEIVLEKFYQKLLKTKAVPKCTDRKHEAKMEFVTPNTIRNVNKLLRSCFNQAMRWDLIEKNPAIHVTLFLCYTSMEHQWSERCLLCVFYDALNYFSRVFGSMKKHLSDVVKQVDLLYPQ